MSQLFSNPLVSFLVTEIIFGLNSYWKKIKSTDNLSLLFSAPLSLTKGCRSYDDFEVAFRTISQKTGTYAIRRKLDSGNFVKRRGILMGLNQDEHRPESSNISMGFVNSSAFSLIFFFSLSSITYVRVTSFNFVTERQSFVRLQQQRPLSLPSIHRRLVQQVSRN